jgi:hypothetical protein
MPSWHQIEAHAPEFASKVRARFEVGINKTIATLRKDGSPRISATELQFDDGEVTLGMMGGSVKLHDARRDLRVAIHNPTIEPTDEPSAWPGEAKLAGLLIETPTPAGNEHTGAGFFRLDIREVALTYLGTPADHLVIESWDPEHGWRRRTH